MAAVRLLEHDVAVEEIGEVARELGDAALDFLIDGEAGIHVAVGDSGGRHTPE
jgi:hypothetical protein